MKSDAKPAHAVVTDLSADGSDFSEELVTRSAFSRRFVFLLVTVLTLIAALAISVGMAKRSAGADQPSTAVTTASAGSSAAASPSRTAASPSAAVSQSTAKSAQAKAAVTTTHKTSAITPGVSAFISTDSAISRNAVRTALQDAVSDQAKQKALAAADAQYEANESNSDQPSSDLAASSAVALKVAAQLKAESVAAVALLNEAAAAAGTTPIAAGSYVLGAHWHETGWWAKWHTGQDFVAPVGTPIHAVADGVVGTPCSGGWAGNNVVIHHANGGSTLYAHMKKTNVKVGQVVKAGDIIGWVGMTGRTFGPHLHFEYYGPGATPGDVYSTSDPIPFLKSLGVTP